MNYCILKWFASAPGEFWKEKIPTQGSRWNRKATITINMNEQQKISGWGGCFNERGWAALLQADEQTRNEIMTDLFDMEQGCKLNLCRMPIGASDYAIDMYSLNDHTDDYAMEHFSIERDKQYLIPYIQAAMEKNPNLKIWASPWSPPAWLKDSGKLTCGHIRRDQACQEALALYFLRFVEEYHKLGIPLFAIMPQNEPCWESLNYPACGYTIEENYEFMKNHLIPMFANHQIDCQVWVGTVLNSEHGITTGFDFVNRVLSDEALAAKIGGVGIQYGKKAMQKTHKKYPDVELMMTETNCGGHENDYTYAQQQFDDILTYLNHGASSFMLWNLVLDETGASLADWKQCSPIVVHSDTGTVDRNPQYYAYKHFSHFVPVGSHKLSCKCKGANGTAFLMPDGKKMVVCFRNTRKNDLNVSIRFHKEELRLTVGGESFNTVQIAL